VDSAESWIIPDFLLSNDTWEWQLPKIL